MIKLFIIHIRQVSLEFIRDSTILLMLITHIISQSLTLKLNLIKRTQMLLRC
ncbi:hypothetical protein BMETH_1393_1 [methanotrophic bacterial endosymbiont of Bathymodiolus sp.]|nr:hypothetical protein BMETH_1393_1 [methanotrophic bacterial endosymbiont of Bathymodiolus sp.]